jgi:hypothetical protein
MSWRTLLTATALALGLSAPALAQEGGGQETSRPADTKVQDALKLVPKDALGFVLINRLGETDRKIAKLAKQLHIPMPEGTPLEIVREKLGVKKGLNEQGSLVLAVLPDLDNTAEPIPIAFIPTSDYPALYKELKAEGDVDGIGSFQSPKERMLIARRGTFAVVAPAKYKAELKKALVATGRTPAGVAPMAAWLSANDITGVLTHKGLKFAIAKAREGMSQARDNLGNIPDPEAGEIAKVMLDGIESFLKSAETDMVAVAGGLRVHKGGHVELSARAPFLKDSGLAKAAAAIEPLEGGALAGLPARPFALAGGGTVPEKAVKSLMRFGFQGMRMTAFKDLPAEKVKQVERVYTEMMKGIQGMSLLFGPPAEDDPLLSNLVAVQKVDDAAAFLARQEKATKALQDALKGLDPPPAPTAEVKRIKVGGRSALQITTDLTADPNLQVLPRPVLDAIFGPGGKLVATAVAVDKTTVVTAYVPPAKMKAILGGKGKGGLAADAGVAKVAAMLPQGAQWVGYFSPRGTIDFVAKGIAQFSPGIIQLPEFPDTPPIGAGLKVGADGIDGRIVVPASTLQGIGRFIQGVKRLQDQ